jgi:hypothetical protein
MQQQYASYRAICAYDLEGDGSLEWLLALPGVEGWQRRALSDGRVIDTLTDVPSVRFASNFLFEDSHPSLYYVSDSVVVVLAGRPVTIVTEPLPTHHRIPLKAWPNPFNSSVILSWPDSGPVNRLTIHNILGQTVRLFELAELRGRAQVSWDACDDRGNALATGIYFARIDTNTGNGVAKLVLLR